MQFKTYLYATSAILMMTASGISYAQQTPPPASNPSEMRVQSQPASPNAVGRNTAAIPMSALHEIKDDRAMVRNLNLSVKELSGMDVYGSDGKKIGDIDKMLADSTKTIQAVTIDVGGFLGIGGREVVIPVDRLQKGTDNKRLQVSMTKNEIEKLENWENRDRTDSGRNLAPAPGAAPIRPSETPTR